MTRFDSGFDSKHDTVHALAAEQHTHAAYEHWLAHHRMKQHGAAAVFEIAKLAHEHSMKAAELSGQALEQNRNMQGIGWLAAG